MKVGSNGFDGIVLAIVLGFVVSGPDAYASDTRSALRSEKPKIVAGAKVSLSTTAAIRALRSHDIARRELAAESLGVHAEAGDADAIAALIELLDATPSKLRYHADWGLARTGAPAVEPLREAFRRETDDVRRARIAQTLGKIGLAARPAAPDMIAALDDPHGQIAARAAYALGAMRAREALPALVRTYAAMRKLPSQRAVATAGSRNRQRESSSTSRRFCRSKPSRSSPVHTTSRDGSLRLNSR